MTIVLFEIVLLGVGIALAVAATVWDRRSAAREEARGAVQAAECLVRDQASGCRTGGTTALRPPTRPARRLGG